MSASIDDLVLAAGLSVLLFGSLEAGFRWGRWAKASSDVAPAGQVGAIQGAILGLLGLLLAFSFSAAGGRFLERQDLIVTEANAIGTAYLRADLLDEPHRSALRDELKAYTAFRIDVSRRLAAGIPRETHNEFGRQHQRIWRAAAAGVKGRPEVALAVTDPVNEVIDLHSTRLAASRKHLPALVLGLLVASSALSVAIIGYGCGIGGRRQAPLTLSLTLLIATALWITVDLDHPRSGVLRLSDEPLKAISFDSPE